MQVAFVEGDIDAFAEHLLADLQTYVDLLPKAAHVVDDHAHIQMARLTVAFRGDRVLSGRPSRRTRWKEFRSIRSAESST